MFFKKYDTVFNYDKKYLPVVKNQIDLLLDDGPQGYYIFTHNESTVKKSTIKGTGVNSFAPVVKINLNEIGDKAIVRFDFSAFKATEIGFAIMLSFPILFILFSLFTLDLMGIFIGIGLIIILSIMFYGFYSLFLNKSIKKITEIFNRIK